MNTMLSSSGASFAPSSGLSAGGGILAASLRLIRLAAVAALLTVALATVLFVPVVIGELAGVETVVRAGLSEPADALAARLGTQFLGLVVLSFGLVAFVLSVLMTPPATTPVFRAARFRGGRGRSRGPAGAHDASVSLKGLPHVRPL